MAAPGRGKGPGALTTATRMYGEMGMRFWLEQADVAMAGLA
jgi:hypothetical protein